MPVTFVAGTGFTQTGTGGTSVSANAPSGLADGDALFAAVYGRTSTFTAPSGWTLQSSASSDFSGGVLDQYLRVFRKNTVVVADAGASFTFSCATTGDFALDRIGVLYSAFRGVDSIPSAAASNSNSIATWSIAPPVVTAATDGSMIAVFASGIFGTSSSTPTPPSSFTLSSGGPFSGIRLAAAYRAVNAGQSNSGNFVLSAETAPTHGMAASTLLLAPASTPVATGIASTVAFGTPTTGDGFVQGYAVTSRFGAAKSGQGYAATGSQFDAAFGVARWGTRVVAGAWTTSLAFGTPALTLSRVVVASSIGKATGVGAPSAFRGAVPSPVGRASSLDVEPAWGIARAVYGVTCAASGLKTTTLPGHGLSIAQKAGAWTVSTAFGTAGPRRGGVASGFAATAFGRPQIGAAGLPQGFALTAFGSPDARGRFTGAATGFSTTQIPPISTSAAPSLRTRGARFRQSWGRAQAERTAP